MEYKKNYQKTKKKLKKQLRTNPERKKRIKKYLTNIAGTAALTGLSAVPGAMGANVWKNRKLGVKNIGKILSKSAKAIKVGSEVKTGLARGAAIGAATTAIKDRWNKSKAQRKTKKAIGKASDALSKGVEKAEKKMKVFHAPYSMAEFAKQDSPLKKVEQAIPKPNPNKATASERFVSWKAKKKLLGSTLKSHGKLRKHKFGKKLGKAQRGVGSVAKNYDRIADIGQKRLSQLGALASATGRSDLKRLSDSAKKALSESKSYVPKHLQKTESNLEKSKRAFDTITTAKTAAKATAIGAAGAGALSLGSKTGAGKKALKAIGSKISNYKVLRRAKKALGK